ncbi:MAG: peptidylprolyl isomerase [Candidatus Thermoplasmatota archaeon]|jgi:FKBP-type peptidyl-prolyl cis-trans isomerase 2|nr:peptidylprolyl isomerase [Candidatus Thermoplasmatota archaeon]
MRCVKKGDKVKVEYTGMLEDGTIFDSSEKHNAPLEFVAGGGQLIKGFDNAVIGMNIGEEKEIKIPPEEAYGMPNPDFVKEVPRDCFPPDQEIKPGMIFVMKMDNGRQIPLRITLVSEDKVTVDLNPPLAGKTLIFKIKLIAIII